MSECIHSRPACDGCLELQHPTSTPKLDVSERHTQNLGGGDEVKDKEE